MTTYHGPRIAAKLLLTTSSVALGLALAMPGQSLAQSATTPSNLPPVMVGAIADVESELEDGAPEGVDPSSWRWTLTWLEGRAVVELDDGTVLHHDPATDTVTRQTIQRT